MPSGAGDYQFLEKLSVKKHNSTQSSPILVSPRSRARLQRRLGEKRVIIPARSCRLSFPRADKSGFASQDCRWCPESLSVALLCRLVGAAVSAPRLPGQLPNSSVTQTCVTILSSSQLPARTHHSVLSPASGPSSFHVQTRYGYS
ncbi:hypothetical protein AOLI_G00088940 [Acnodon oligacanthus]